MQSITQAIQKQKEKLNATIVAHYYQDAAIQDIADFVGDSLALAQYCNASQADSIVLCGVKFMAETAKILNPEKLVLLPDLEAGCSLADSCQAAPFNYFLSRLDEKPTVVMYINSNIEIKAMSDYIVTSSNAEKILRAIPQDQKILFGPDRHLGRYLMEKTGREMILWQGSCIVHETFNLKKLMQMKIKHTDSLVIAHPECDSDILDESNFVGSTTQLIKFTQESKNNSFIVLTESGVIHQMKKLSPNKEFIEGPNSSGCSCNECPYMRLNTLEKILECMEKQSPQINVDIQMREAALKPLNRMLELS